MRERTPCVYILASRERGTLYIGVTSDLPQRVWQHRTGQVEGFTRQYTVTRLVWFEVHEEMLSAIAREKRLKAWRRGGVHGRLCSSNRTTPAGLTCIPEYMRDRMAREIKDGPQRSVGRRSDGT